MLKRSRLLSLLFLILNSLDRTNYQSSTQKNLTSTPTPKKRNLIYAAIDTKKPYVERKVGLMKSFMADIVNYAVAFCIACLRTAFWRLNTIRPSKPINMALKTR